MAATAGVLAVAVKVVVVEADVDAVETQQHVRYEGRAPCLVERRPGGGAPTATSTTGTTLLLLLLLWRRCSFFEVCPCVYVCVRGQSCRQNPCGARNV